MLILPTTPRSWSDDVFVVVAADVSEPTKERVPPADKSVSVELLFRILNPDAVSAYTLTLAEEGSEGALA